MGGVVLGNHTLTRRTVVFWSDGENPPKNSLIYNPMLHYALKLPNVRFWLWGESRATISWVYIKTYRCTTKDISPNLVDVSPVHFSTVWAL